MRRKTFVDLFCGAGGATQGFRDAGYRPVLAIDIDPVAIATYRLNHPRARAIAEDIRLVDPRVLASTVAGVDDLDVLVACPPCQGFSTIRTRRRRTVVDARNDLIFEVARFAEALMPRAIVIENVTGLERDARWARLLGRLEGIGYRMASRTVNAADYGVPQRRNRLVAVGVLGVLEPPPLVPTTRRRSVRTAIGRLGPPLANGNDPLHAPAGARSARIMQLIAAIPKDGGGRRSLPAEMQLACHQQVRGFWDVYGRMGWDSVAPTITGGCINPSKGRFLHPSEDRAITLREAALLQSFPSRYRFSLQGGRYKVAELIGNAVPPRLAAAQGRSLRSVLDGFTS